MFLFFVVPRVGLQSVIVAFSGQTHLNFGIHVIPRPRSVYPNDILPLGLAFDHNPFKPSVLFMGHRQTV